MRRRLFVLTELEDSALAACDDQFLEARSAQIVLGSWFDRRISTRELRQLYRKLADLGLLGAYIKRSGRIVRSQFTGCRTASLLVRATAKGRKYLSAPRRVV